MAERQPDALGDVGLAPVGGPEGHRRRDVEHEPRGQGTLGDVDPDVRDRRPGGDVPVDPPDVVARLVGTDLGELGATAEVVRPVLAGHEAADPPPDGHVERAQERLGRGARPGLRGRTRPGEGGQASCAPLRRDRRIGGGELRDRARPAAGGRGSCRP